MRGRLPGAVVLVSAAWMAFGQAAPAGPAFEVASVKPAARPTGGGPRRISSSDPGRVTYNNVTLRTLLIRAYQVKDYQIAGPDWLPSERYDVTAKLPEGTPKEQVSLMLQALLADRFQLALHHERKEMQGYALAVGKNGFKLKPVDDASTGIKLRIGGSLTGINGKLTLAGLASALGGFIGGPVEDATGIAGTFDINLEWSPDDREKGISAMRFAAREGGEAAAGSTANPVNPPDVPSGPSLFAAVQNLGLKLEPRKVPMDILVIDRAGKMPTEN